MFADQLPGKRIGDTPILAKYHRSTIGGITDLAKPLLNCNADVSTYPVGAIAVNNFQENISLLPCHADFPLKLGQCLADQRHILL